jgi:hypothetical protein
MKMVMAFCHKENSCSATDCDDTPGSGAEVYPGADGTNDQGCGPQTPYIGQLRDGGIVFWIDPNDPTKGLVCRLEDYNERQEKFNVEWGCGSINLGSVPDNYCFFLDCDTPEAISGAGAQIGDGITNTNGILNDCDTAPAALAARSYGKEWFLPSIKELIEMYNNKEEVEAVEGFDDFSGFYWSSTEHSETLVWGMTFTEEMEKVLTKGDKVNVRAVRAF